MVRSEWSCIFPLCISDSIAFADCEPPIFTSRNSRALVSIFEPGNNARRFRPVPGMCLVVVRKCAVKWVLPRSKFYWNVTTPMSRIRIVKTAIAFCPLFVPRACAIRDEIVSAWRFADPEDCCYNIYFPWVPLRNPRGGRFSDERLVFFRDRLALSSKSQISHDQKCETKRDKCAALPHDFSNPFPFKHCVKQRRTASRFGL